MPIDSSIAMGVRPVQFDDPMNGLAKLMGVQRMQQEGQLSGLRMDEYQRGIAETNKLNQLYSGAINPDGTINRTKLLTGAATGGLGSKIPGLQKGLLETDEAQGKVAKQKVELVDSVLRQSREYLTGVKTPEQYIEWTNANFADPILGPALRARGMTPEKAAETTRQMLQQPGGLDRLIQESAVGMTKFTELNKPTLKQVDSGQTIEIQSFPGMGGAPSVVGTTQKLQTPDSKAKEAAAANAKTAPKPIPPTSLRQQNDSLEVIASASGVNADLSAMHKQIADGKLTFGPASNLINRARNATGNSTEESRNFASFKTNLERLRNESLRLNKGVQTDGDAQRAWNELFDNINDTELVKKRLEEIQGINERGVNLHKMLVENIRSNYNQEPMDTSKYEKQPSPYGGGKAAPSLKDIEAEIARRKKAQQNPEGGW